jgi:hypothetical protein
VSDTTFNASPECKTYLEPPSIICNILPATIGSNDIYLVKSAPIVAGSMLQIIDGGSRYVLHSGDALKVVSDTASSADVWVSAVDAISA